MLNTSYARRGIAVASHSLAAKSALAVLREGGNAIEATVAAASTIAVVYPHMTGIGGDAFWLVAAHGEAVFAIDACGPAAVAASVDSYRGLHSIPPRGPLAANTVAGTVAGWQLALEISRARWGGKLPLPRLLEDSIWFAANGIPATASQEANTAAKRAELELQPGFAERFLSGGGVPRCGEMFVQGKLASTLQRLARAGLNDFYRGELAQALADDLVRLGSPLRAADLRAYAAREVKPLELAHTVGTLYNMTPPTQGVVSLAILGILERLGLDRMEADGPDHVHAIVEATKQAFLKIRDKHVTDPA